MSGSEQAVHQEIIPSGPWSSSYGRLPDEPPLNYSVEEMVPCGEAFEVARSLAELGAAPAAVMLGSEGVEVAAPTLVDHPSANVVERTSASSLISSASAERDQDAGGGAGCFQHHSARQSALQPNQPPTEETMNNQADIIIDLFNDPEEIEEAEVTKFMEKWTREMLPTFERLQCQIQSGCVPLGTLLAMQREVFENFSIFFLGLPPEYKYAMISRVAPGWAELADLMEKNRVLATKLLAKRSAAHG